MDDTKTLSSLRTLPLIPNIKTYLLELKAKQEDKIEFGSEYNDNDYICKWEDGKPLSPDYVTHKFKTILNDNNLTPIRFHDLRHSSASLVIELGFSLKEVQEWLGHGDIGTTVDLLQGNDLRQEPILKHCSVKRLKSSLFCFLHFLYLLLLPFYVKLITVDLRRVILLVAYICNSVVTLRNLY